MRYKDIDVVELKVNWMMKHGFKYIDEKEPYFSYKGKRGWIYKVFKKDLKKTPFKIIVYNKLYRDKLINRGKLTRLYNAFRKSKEFKKNNEF